MRRLATQDAMMLYQELTRNDYLHSTRVVILDPGPYSSLQIKQIMERECSRSEPLQWRLQPVPLRLNYPLWRNDPDFDVTQHVSRIACPAPGGERELCEVISQITSRPLERTRPMWECWVIEGLRDGRVAVVSKVHHALADGVGTNTLVEDTLATEPAPIGARPLRDLEPEHAPSGWVLARQAIADGVKQASGAVPTLWSKRKQIKRAQVSPSDDLVAAQLGDGPPTFLNREPVSHRAYAFTTIPLAELTTVKDAFGTTLNDLLLAITAGAVRELLVQRGELPDRPLIAGMPLSTRAPDDPKQYGNQITVLGVRLRTDIADPVARLAATKREADVAKDAFRRTVGARPEDFLTLIPPPLLVLALRALRRQITRGVPVLGNLAVSNVPGPRKHLYSADRRVDALFGSGPLAPGHSLSLTAWSYVDSFNVSFIAARDVFPDLWPFVELFRASFDELRAAARELAATTKDGVQ